MTDTAEADYATVELIVNVLHRLFPSFDYRFKWIFQFGVQMLSYFLVIAIYDIDSLLQIIDILLIAVFGAIFVFLINSRNSILYRWLVDEMRESLPKVCC